MEQMRELRAQFKGAKMIAIVRIQRLFRKVRSALKETRLRGKLKAVVEGWRVRRLLKLPELVSIMRGIRDLKILISELRSEKEKPTKALLEKMKKDLPLRVVEFNEAYKKAYVERRWETSEEEIKQKEKQQKLA